MSEKINSEINEEEILDSVPEEEEKTVVADEDNAAVAADKVVDDAEKTVLADEDTENPTASDELAETADAAEETAEIKPEGEETEVKKKKSFLQLPVIIACAIVLLAIIGFLAYMAFFLKEPENVTWSNTVDEVTYYYEFSSDGTFKGYLGSIEIAGSYQKTAGEEGQTITVDKTFGSFYQNMPATYSISGSRLFGNQEMTCTYSEDYQFTLKQGKREKKQLDLPEDFTADENLVGTWIFRYMNYDIYKVTFNNDGSMVLEFVQDGVKYNGVYTLEDSKINFTYYANDSTVVPIDYSVDGDILTFMGYAFVREGSDATPDQQVITQQAEETAAAEAQATEAVEETTAE